MADDTPAPPGRRKLIFLIGAHKTASSHLQQSLLASETELRDRGVALIAPKTMRRHLNPISLLVRDGVPAEIMRGAAEAFLPYHAGDAARVVMMDENIPGVTDKRFLMRPGKLYPWVKQRFGRLVEFYEDHEIEIGLAVRHPAAFLTSCWSESLHHCPYCSFRDFIDGIDPAGLTWAGFIERLREIAPNARIFVWQYEAYDRLLAVLYARILGADAAGLVQPSAHLARPGLSAKAAEWLLQQTDPDKETMIEARKRFPKGPGDAGFNPWSAAERDRLSRSYAADLQAIAAMEHVELLQPAHAATRQSPA